MRTQKNLRDQLVAKRVIQALGETAAVARICRIDMAAVSQWKTNGVPKYRMDFFEAKFPDLDWDYLQGRTNKTKSIAQSTTNRRKNDPKP